MTRPEPREWYCPKCGKFVASDELSSPVVRVPIHLPCKGKAERRTMVIGTEPGCGSECDKEG